jgi:hypothetical protein
MEIVRSSIVGGIAATGVLTVFLLVADSLLAGTNLFVLATFMSLCAIGGPPYCEPGGLMAAALTFVSFLALFALAWPLLFAGFTWGLPGKSGLTHGVIFGLVLWTGYVGTVLYGIGTGGETLAASLPLLVVMLSAYLVYGLVLGGVYDRLAGHRTFLGSPVD